MLPPCTVDPIPLVQRLLRCSSVTPDEAGTFGIVEEFLVARGFSIERFDFQGVGNLYARAGTAAPHLCFAGHTDVVPAGNKADWSFPPFSGHIEEGKLYGRGVVDMKGAIGAYLVALDGYLQTSPLKGSLSVLLTTDEEGPAIHGLRQVTQSFQARGEQIDACLVGEPTNEQRIGDTVKIGRRGSLNATVTVRGRSGHVAYPHLAQNPIPPLLAYLQTLVSRPLDAGMEKFNPSHLEVTSIDGANLAQNVIPAEAKAQFNIRFNPLHTPQSLIDYLHRVAMQVGLSHQGLSYTLETQGSGNAFLCENKALESLVCEAVLAVTGVAPTLSTSGGTSDARFLKRICPTIEFGLINATAHQIDEHIQVEDIHCLAAVYQRIIDAFFKAPIPSLP